MSVWFVKPEEVQLDLIYTDPAGEEHRFWIRVKKMLNIGEQRRVMTAGWLAEGIDWRVNSFARTAEYLCGWSFTDDEGRAVPLSSQTIEALDPAVYDLISEAITTHVLAVAEAKKRSAGSSRPSLMSA